jgi:hypothetical protein
MEESHARVITKIIAVLSFIGALLMLGLAGIIAVAGGLGAAGPLAELGSAAAFVGGSIAVVFVLIAIYSLVTGIGLWRMRNWGRIMFLIGAWIDLVFGVINLATSFAGFMIADIIGAIIGLAITGFFIWFFQFNDVVRSLFVGNKPTPASTEVGTTDASFQPVEAMMVAESSEAAKAPQPVMETTSVKATPAARPMKKAPARKAAKPARKAVAKPVKKAAKRKPVAKKKK